LLISTTSPSFFSSDLMVRTYRFDPWLDTYRLV
jgi:hypothetical protein